MKRFYCLLLAMLLAVTPCFAEISSTRPEESTSPSAPFKVETPDGSWPQINEAGYLDEGEFVYENTGEGIWRYCSSTLKVEIIRKQSDKPKRIWYEAEVWSRKEIWDLVQAEPGKYISAVQIQPVIASRNGLVLALNSDEANYRWPKKDASVGILLRNHKILWDKTKKAGYKGFPNLDTLALYDDGRMEVYNNAEKTAQEFLDMGALHVLSFGPYLIRDGVLNEKRCRIYDGSSGVARIGIGQIGEGHYMAIMCEGRTKTSRGCNVWWLANQMASRGCVTAFNLDGGRTASIEFMGKQICTVGAAPVKGGYARKASELLYIGKSTLVQGYDPSTAK